MVETKTIATGLLTGVLIGIGWWAFFDGVVYAPDAFPWLHSIPAIGAVIVLLMLNSVSLEQVKEMRIVRVWTFITLTCGCTCIGGAIWITAVEYPPAIEDNWPGVSIIIQTVFVLIAAIVLFVGKSLNDGDNKF